jgi:hypothetical protein
MTHCGTFGEITSKHTLRHFFMLFHVFHSSRHVLCFSNCYRKHCAQQFGQNLNYSMNNIYLLKWTQQVENNRQLQTIPTPFMGPEGSLPCPEGSATGPIVLICTASRRIRRAGYVARINTKEMHMRYYLRSQKE